MLSERDLERISFIAQNGAEGQEVCALEICVAAVPEMVAEIRRLQHEAVKSEETERKRDEDIGRVQRAVYDELCAGMTILGLDPAHIDGAGSDGDEAVFTGAEVAQFVNAATDMVDELRQECAAARADLERAQTEAAAMRGRIEAAIKHLAACYVEGAGADIVEGLLQEALSSSAGADLLEETKRLREMRDRLNRLERYGVEGTYYRIKDVQDALGEDGCL